MKRLVIVTGSSRGIGEAIASQLNDTFAANTHLILIARDLAKLEQVKENLLAKSQSNRCTIVQHDFSRPFEVADFYKLLKNLFPTDENDAESISTYDALYCIYNHATLLHGDVSLSAQESLRTSYEVNLFSVWNMVAAINLLMPPSAIAKQFHVNLSSNFGRRAEANWAGQCTVRASRQMLFKCLALEQPKLRVLNYFPGLVFTDMFKYAGEINQEFQNMIDEDKCLKPEDTAAYLVKLLVEDTFESGASIEMPSN